MKISLIVAVDLNNGIGKDNQLPWHLPADLKHFKNLTSGHPVLMGRKTFDSIGKALPNRRNIVISRQSGVEFPGVEFCNSLEQAVMLCKNEDEIFIIGGSQIFEQALPLSDTLYLTRIDHNFEADTFFPEINPEQWIEIEKNHHHPDQKNLYSYSFIKYRKV